MKGKLHGPRMCDMAEEEFAEYLRWQEAARARARAPNPLPRTRPIVLQGIPPASDAVEA